MNYRELLNFLNTLSESDLDREVLVYAYDELLPVTAGMYNEADLGVAGSGDDIPFLVAVEN
jgi:hypothetical protein